MFIAFLIMLREGVEAALLVGIIATYLKQSGNQKYLTAVFVGVITAALLCLGLGLEIHYRTGEIPQKEQELIAGIIGLVAVCMLTFMIFWMKGVAQSKIHQSIDKVLNKGKFQAISLVLMAFLAVAREGMESVFFLIAVFEQSEGYAMIVGSILGLVTAIVIGVLIYLGGTRINMAKFFHWTSVFLIFITAGLFAGSLRALHEAGIWNIGQTMVANLSAIIPETNLFGVMLSGLFGYTEAPTVSDLVAWGGYLVFAFALFYRTKKKQISGNKQLSKKIV